MFQNFKSIRNLTPQQGKLELYTHNKQIQHKTIKSSQLM